MTAVVTPASLLTDSPTDLSDWSAVGGLRFKMSSLVKEFGPLSSCLWCCTSLQCAHYRAGRHVGLTIRVQMVWFGSFPDGGVVGLRDADHPHEIRVQLSSDAVDLP